MLKELKSLEGKEISILELSNELQLLDCEDICDFGNLDELLKEESFVVATEETGNDHIMVFFKVIYEANEDENVLANIIKVTEIKDF